ncbi:MAG: hypothetical protein HS101_14210 [Planctomycetia bacterium]|nr:hypothetical protein [Planctomycetia bacterium]MCC7314618.1 hypothetical protein [Planctomycetota bacterium]
MPFLSGTVAFSRFHVVGGSPKRVDEKFLEKFREHAIGKRRHPTSNDEEVGWIGGRHLLDREFDAEKNILLDCLHFGMRIDSAKVPPDVMHAYVQQELDSLLKDQPPAPARADEGSDMAESLAATGKVKGFAKLKKQAVEAAKHRAAQEIRQGRFAVMRQVPILWDTATDILYVGATQPAIFERLIPLFKDTFDKKLEPVTSGTMAYRWAEGNGLSRRIEAMQAAKYVEHENGNGHTDIYWTARDPASRDFLGNEFLLWLWFTLATQGDTIALEDKTEAAMIIVKQLVLECPWAESGKATLAAPGPASLPESLRAIRAGKLPRKAGLMISRQGEQYELVLQAETLGVSGAVLPKLEIDSGPRAVFEERIEQIRHLSATIDLLFRAFLERRTAADWQTTLESLKQWMTGAQEVEPMVRRAAAAPIVNEAASVV